MKRIFNIYLILSVIIIQNLLSQESADQTKPVELPGVIFFGKEQLRISSSIKQFPEKPSKLTTAELDSLNTLEKQQAFLIPSKPLPTNILSTYYKQNYLEAQFGSFLTTKAEAGFSLDLFDLKFFGKANLDLSNGHIEQSGYSKIAFSIANDYIAPEKFWIFGGSRTRSILRINNNNYNLYSIPTGVNRNLFDMNFKINSEGNYEGINFITGGKAGILQLSQKTGNAFDNYISGFLGLKSKIDDLNIGGNISLDLHNIRGDGVNFFELDGSFIYSIFDAKLGFQFGKSSKTDTRANILIECNVNYVLNESFTLKASISQVLVKNSLFDMISYNPYASDSVVIDFETKRTLKSYIFYRPNTEILLSAGVFAGFNENTPYFISDSSGAFIAKYEATNNFGFNSEGEWQMTKEDNINYNFEFNLKTLKSNSNVVPHHTPLKFAINYRRNWNDDLSSIISIVYIGQRFADLDNKQNLDSYFNINLLGNYKFSNTFSIFAKIENLLNSDVRIWDGYRERGIFVSAGILWEF